MRKSNYAGSICLLAMLFFTAALACPANAQEIPFVFEIPSSYNASDVHVQFLSTSGITGWYKDVNGATQTLTTTDHYSLAEITSPTSVGGEVPANKPAVVISKFVSGRCYITIGNSTAMNPISQPAAQTSTDTWYYQRYQYFEPTIGAGDNKLWVDLTYIDFASIALSMEVINGPHAVNNPQNTTVTSKRLADAVAKTSVSNRAVIPPNALPPDTTFARVLSPSLAADIPGSAAGYYYHDWADYLTFLKDKSVHVKGWFVGSAAGSGSRFVAQTYDYNATFDGTNVNFTPISGSGDSGDGSNPGVGDTSAASITVTYTELSKPAGIYGNNPAYTAGGTSYSGIQNDYYGKVVGDLMAGMVWGFAGSTEVWNGTVLGDMYTTQWFSGYTAAGQEIKAANTPAGQGFCFDKAQPGKPDYYHTYAAALAPLTSGYGTAFQDRLQGNTINVDYVTQDTDAYLKIWIEPEATNTPVTPGPSQGNQTNGTGGGGGGGGGGTPVVPTVVVHTTVTKEKNATTLQQEYQADNFDPITSVCEFNATLSPATGLNATFMMDTHKIPNGTVSQVTLMKLYSNGTCKPYTYAPDNSTYRDGYWWLTDDQYAYLSAGTQVTNGTQYYIHFVVQDNGEYDENATLGGITDPVAAGVPLTASSSGSSTGCMMNPSAGLSFELLALLIIPLAAYIGRRKNN